MFDVLLERIGGIIIVLIVLGGLTVMIVPLPTFLVDILILTNFVVAVSLYNGTYSSKNFDITILSTLFLILILFQYALSISLSRLIIVEGFAGDIVGWIAALISDYNFAVGSIFSLLIIVFQFLAIIRISEDLAAYVSRCELQFSDAMTIDAQTVLTSQMAHEEIVADKTGMGQNTDFFGTINTTSKFMQGGAIALIIILLVSISAGSIVGIQHHNLDIMQAIKQYAPLAIGAGIVVQTPTLLVALAMEKAVYVIVPEISMLYCLRNQIKH